MVWCLDKLELEGPWVNGDLDTLPLPTAGDGAQPVTEELDTLPLSCDAGPGPGGEATEAKPYSGDAMAHGLGMN